MEAPATCPPLASHTGQAQQVDGQGRHLDLGPTHSSLTPLDQGTATSGRGVLPSHPSDDDADRNLQGEEESGPVLPQPE